MSVSCNQIWWESFEMRFYIFGRVRLSLKIPSYQEQRSNSEGLLNCPLSNSASWLCAVYFVVRTFISIHNKRTSTSIEIKAYKNETVCFAFLVGNDKMEIAHKMAYHILRKFNITDEGRSRTCSFSVCLSVSLFP